MDSERCILPTFIHQPFYSLRVQTPSNSCQHKRKHIATLCHCLHYPIQIDHHESTAGMLEDSVLSRLAGSIMFSS